MGYFIYIEYQRLGPGSKPEPISIDAWRAAVLATTNVRLFSGEAQPVTNPRTGRAIGVCDAESDAEVYSPDSGDWRLIFQWRRGSIRFLALPRAGDKSDPIWAAAVTLARQLGAVIRGEEGELYDLQDGVINFPD